MKCKSLLALAAVCVAAGLTASAPATAAGAPPRCVTVYDFPDAGLVYCYDLQGECTLSETRTTFIGTETRCVIERPAGSRSAGPRCVGNGALDVKYCVDPDGSCLVASYSSAAGSRCWVRNP